MQKNLIKKKEKMILTNILQGKKYGVVQTDSPMSRDYLF